MSGLEGHGTNRPANEDQGMRPLGTRLKAYQQTIKQDSRQPLDKFAERLGLRETQMGLTLDKFVNDTNDHF